MKESKLHKINVLEKTDASALDSQDNPIFKALCRQLSLDVAKACKAAGSGHLKSKRPALQKQILSRQLNNLKLRWMLKKHRRP